MTDRFLIVMAFVLFPLCASSAQHGAADRSPIGAGIAIEMGDAGLTGHVRRTVRHELQRIWAHHGVTLTWPDRLSDLSTACAAVKVVFTDAEPGLRRRPGRKPLGIVYRIDGYMRRIIFISPAAVLSLVRKGTAERGDSLMISILHARMMARVIAHEMGHILLDSEEHSPRGLMRGRFTALDVHRDGPAHFGLEPHELDRVARRCPGKTPT